MTFSAGPPAPLAQPPAAPPESVAGNAEPQRERAQQLRAAALLVGVLAVLGALLGVLWQVWSPPGPAGIELPAGIQADETEAWVAGDGRFALITVLVGLAAGFAAWYVPTLRRTRGPYVALGLAVGGIGGAALTDLIGWALRGDGSQYKCGDGSLTCIDHLPLTVHMHGLWFLEAVAATLVYVLFVAFAVADDLGRPDSLPAASASAASPLPPAPPQLGRQPGSVGTDRDLQQPWRYGDGAGPPQ